MAKLLAVNADGTLTPAGTTLKLKSYEVGSSDGSIENIRALTRAEYTALPTKDPKTLYYITDEV
jgi:hypothetical protein